MSPNSEGPWIIIPDWDRFQHYSDRDPVWLKTYTRLLSDPAYLNLTLSQRGLLHGIWLEYARSARSVPVATRYVSRQLGGRVTKGMVKALSDAGFIEVSASRPLAQRYHDASAEKNREEKRFSREESSARANRPAASAYKPFETNGAEPLPAAEALELARQLAAGEEPGDDLEHEPTSPNGAHKPTIDEVAW